MFDIGALELLLIGLVALIVVGPERLPRLARTAGLWVGRARRALTSVKEEIDREIKADELKEILRKQSQNRPLDTILEEGVGLSEQSRSLKTGSAGSSSSAQWSSADHEPGDAIQGQADTGGSEQQDDHADRR
ncbi:MAG: twin-arginine translocase subunit TatB [Gammaproteobacteria bacterium]|jgi:sec-independent protein translocase protein TatB|nr:twin-arginine translocase subunit TatB [Gammaproteobacteria bacterium]